jgi:protein-S-isoprenylcysteine O-methyltransferase Ste14
MKVLLLATGLGAIVGAISTSLDFHVLASIPAFVPDRALLGHGGFLVACMAGWALFSVYWESSAKNVAVAKSSESRASRRLHVLLANVALVLEIAPIHGLGRFVPATPLIMSAGIAVEAAGLFLAIWARRHLGRNWNGEISIKVEHQLIRSGPYRLSRHPIYTGLLAMYAGVALVTGEWLAVIGVAMAAFAYWRKIRLEEATLVAAFGEEYAAYRRTT